jgi:hypothetical protein
MTPEAMREFESVRIGEAEVVVRRDFRSGLEALGLHRAGFAPPEGAARYRGRGDVFVLEVPGFPAARAVVRPCRHGGLSGALFGRWFAGRSRAARELRSSAEALARGVPTVRPLAAVTIRSLGLFYRAWFVSEEAAGASDLAALAAEAARDPARRGALRAAARAAGEAVRTMHDAGFFHADLNLKNVLVAESEGKARALVLDWDRAAGRDAPLSRRRRMRNLMRMDRSARKFEAAGVPVPLKERLRFLKHYFAAGGVEPPTRAELRRWAWASRLHSLAWALFG